VSYQLIIRRDDGGDLPADVGNVHFVDADQVTIGSGSDCDLTLPGLPDRCLTIERKTGGDFRVAHMAAGILLQVGGSEVVEISAPVRNGDVMMVAGYAIQFVVVFRDARQDRKTGILAPITTVVVIVIFIFEVGVIVWLPKETRTRELWSLEIARQRVLYVLDELRPRCIQWQVSSAGSETTMTVALVKAELDRIALFLRDHAGAVKRDHLDLLYSDLLMFESLLGRLEAEKLYPPPEVIDVGDALQRITEEYHPDNSSIPE